MVLPNAWNLDEPTGRVEAFARYIARRESYADHAYESLKPALERLTRRHAPDLEARFAFEFRGVVQSNRWSWDGHAWAAWDDAVAASITRRGGSPRSEGFRLQLLTPKMDRLAIAAGLLVARLHSLDPARASDHKQSFLIASYTALVLAGLVREVVVHSFYDGGHRPARLSSAEWARHRERLVIGTSPEMKAWTDLDWGRKWLPGISLGNLRHAIAHGGTVVHDDRLDVFVDAASDVPDISLGWREVADIIDAAEGAWHAFLLALLVSSSVSQGNFGRTD